MLVLNEVSLGADPEGFFYSPTVKKVVPSIGKIGGTKEAPLPTPGGAILEDNVAVEFNTVPVKFSDGERAFVESISAAKKDVNTIAEALGLEVKYIPQADFDPIFLKSAEAQESGCDPDFNIYSGEQNQYPPLSESNTRFCGGHIHIGHEAILKNPRLLHYIVASLDLWLTIPLAYISKVDQSKRAATYGKLGNFRPKPYGLEYRSCSNEWVDKEDLMLFARWCVGQAIRDALADRNRARDAIRASELYYKGDFSNAMDFVPRESLLFLSKRGLV